MKRVLFVILFLAVIISACGPSEADIQKAIAETQAVYTPTARPTETLTVEEAYCANLTDAKTQFQQFSSAITEWLAFLEKPVGGSYSGTWGELIGLSIMGGGSFMGPGLKNSQDQNIRQGVAKFIALSKGLEEAGVKLQIKMTAVAPPQSLKLSHDKVLACIEPVTTGMSEIVAFFDGEAAKFPNFDGCSQFGLYSEQILNTCANK